MGNTYKFYGDHNDFHKLIVSLEREQDVLLINSFDVYQTKILKAEDIKNRIDRGKFEINRLDRVNLSLDPVLIVYSNYQPVMGFA